MKRFSLAGRKVMTLAPGDLYFGATSALLYTLLGSCVAITVWHPPSGRGGMCHYLLGQRTESTQHRALRQGYFATDAVSYFLRRLSESHIEPSACVVKIFGGGSMLGGAAFVSGRLSVSEDNIRIGRLLLQEAGFSPSVSDVGGHRYRKLYFELTTGAVWVKYGHAEHYSRENVLK